MKKNILILAAGFFFVGALFCGAISAGTKEDAIALVKKGVEFIEANGPEKAAEAFQTPEFKNGDLYLFSYDYKGNCQAQGAMPQLVGKNLWNLKSPTGKPLIRDLAELAQKNGGWIEYEWNHETKKVLMTKVTYVQPVAGKEMFVGCGFYKE